MLGLVVMLIRVLVLLFVVMLLLVLVVVVTLRVSLEKLTLRVKAVKVVKATKRWKPGHYTACHWHCFDVMDLGRKSLQWSNNVTEVVKSWFILLDNIVQINETIDFGLLRSFSTLSNMQTEKLVDLWLKQQKSTKNQIFLTNM